jgi:hypothetical protein
MYLETLEDKISKHRERSIMCRQEIVEKAKRFDKDLREVYYEMVEKEKIEKYNKYVEKFHKHKKFKVILKQMFNVNCR